MYDALNRLTIDGDVYTLDAAGNRTAKTDDLAGVTSNYTYDPIYELTQVQQANSTTESYSYDPVGNRLSSLGVPSYTVNTSNELTGSSNASYTYDQNGNTTSKTDSTGTTNYTWDFENRLVGVTLFGTGGIATFKDDPFGRRIQKAFTQNGTTTTNYLYSGDNVVETTDQNGSVTAKFAQGQSIDEPLAESTSSGVDYYEQDGLGSVTSLTDGAGQLAQTYTYDSYGNTTNSSGNVANPFRYTARDFDSETGLYYYRARYYDPSTGRFLSEDPLRFGIGPTVHVQRPNIGPSLIYLMTRDARVGRSAEFYSYTRNDPNNNTDPRGLWQVTAGGGDGIGILLTFGHNNGQWNIGLDVGGAAGGFFSFDPNDEECNCGFNAHLEGDLGIIGLEGVGGSLNVNQNGSTSGTITFSDPNQQYQTWQWDPSQPDEPPQPTFSVGAGIFSGAGYTECF